MADRTSQSTKHRTSSDKARTDKTRTDATPAPVVKPPKEPRPGKMPADGDDVRPVGHTAAQDIESGRKDTDQHGFDAQRQQSPRAAPTRADDSDEGLARSTRTDKSD